MFLRPVKSRRPSGAVPFLHACLALGVLAASSAIVRAAEAQDPKLARLGIVFQPAAPTTSVHGANPGGTLDPLPADPDVIRLPNYTITDQRIDVEERQLLTPKGRREVALKRYINPAYAKTLGPVMAVATFLNNPLGGWAPNTPEAMALYWDDERTARIRQVNELTELAALADRLNRPSADLLDAKKKPAKK